MSDHSISTTSNSSQRFSAKEAIPAFGVTRILTGLGLIAAPTWYLRAIGVNDLDSRRLAWIYRGLGVRDLALGIGTMRAWLYDEPLNGWLAALAATRAADAAAFAVGATKGELGLARGWALASVSALGSAAEAYVAITTEQEEADETDWHELTRLDAISDWAESVPFDTE